MALATKTFRYALDAASGVATITLDRPERLNALTFGVYEELRDTFARLDTEPGVRAIAQVRRNGERHRSGRPFARERMRFSARRCREIKPQGRALERLERRLVAPFVRAGELIVDGSAQHGRTLAALQHVRKPGVADVVEIDDCSFVEA